VALSTYGFSEHFSESAPRENAPLDIRKSSDLIKSICQKSHVTSNMALASLPTFSVFSSIININNSINKKDLDAAINWEAKKVIPLPLQDIVIDWQIIDEPTSTSGGHKILLTGAPKNLIQNYIGIFKASQLNLLSLETEIFALIRSLLGNDRSSVMIVQLGSTTTNVFVVDKSVPVINRSIAVGGINITQAIASHLNMTMAQAEQFKYDLMYHNNQGEEAGKLPAMVAESFAPIINEIKYIIEVFGSKDNRRIEKIILTGGGALLPGLTNYLADKFNLNTIVGDPWFRVAYPFELKPILDKIGPRLAVAVGLAMREFDRR
jgi:type IV pilus assembly protein PilM